MIQVVSEPITKAMLRNVAEGQFGDMVKAVVDIDKGIMAIGGELHADEEAHLLEAGSRQENLWGINLYFNLPEEEWLEFDSMINIRPSCANRSRGVESPEIRGRILEIVRGLIIHG